MLWVLMVVICSSLSHRTLKILTDPSTFSSISMGRGTAWKAHDVDVVRGWMAAGKTTTAMAELRPDWSRSSIKKLVARFERTGWRDCTCVHSQAVLHSGFQRPSGRAQGRITHTVSCVCCRCRKKNLGPPVPQRGGCCTTDWRKSHRSLSKLSGSLLLPFSVSLLRRQRAQPRVGLHSRVHSVEQAE